MRIRQYLEGFLAEYRRHPLWLVALLALMIIGLSLDYALISPEPPSSSPVPGVLTA